MVFNFGSDRDIGLLLSICYIPIFTAFICVLFKNSLLCSKSNITPKIPKFNSLDSNGSSRRNSSNSFVTIIQIPGHSQELKYEKYSKRNCLLGIVENDLREYSVLFCIGMLIQSFLRIFFFMVPLYISEKSSFAPGLNEMFGTLPGVMFFINLGVAILQWIKLYTPEKYDPLFSRSRIFFYIFGTIFCTGQLIIFYFILSEMQAPTYEDPKITELVLAIQFVISGTVYALFPIFVAVMYRNRPENEDSSYQNTYNSYCILSLLLFVRMSMVSVSTYYFNGSLSLRDVTPENEAVGKTLLAYYIVGEMLPSLLLLQLQWNFPRYRRHTNRDRRPLTPDEKTPLTGRSPESKYDRVLENSKISALSPYAAHRKLASSLSTSCVLDENDVIKGKLLGSGGNGAVYEATFQGITNVAVKESFMMMSEIEEDHQDFLQEIEFLSKLRHPHIVQFYGIYTVEQRIFLVMELCATNLSDHMKKSNLTLQEKVRILKQIALAMKHLHTRDILHRDIKPENVLMTENGTVKLADFGLARTLSDSFLRTMSFGGTPDYSAPEIIEKRQYSKKSDMYGFGALAWVLYTQKVMFSEETTPFEMMAFITSGKRLSIPNECPRVYREIIENAWAQNPDQRPDFETILEWLDEDITTESGNPLVKLDF